MKHFVILAMLALAVPCLAQNVTSRADFPGTGRFGAVQFSINNDVYVGLGEAGAGNYPKDFYKYDATNNQWTAIATFPGAGRETGIAFALNGKGYVGLGAAFISTSTTVFKDLWRYDPATNAWTQLTNFDGPARSKAAVLVLNGAAYIGTGTDDQFTFLSDWWKYNLASDSWTLQNNLGNLPPRYGATAWVINNKAYLGGGRGNGNLLFSEIHEFNPNAAANGWVLKISDAANLPFVSAATFVLDNKAYLCYGLNATFISRYNPANNTVTNLGDLLGLSEPLRYAPVAGTTSSGQGYLGLGYASVVANQTAAYRKDFWQFNPVTTATTALDAPAPVKVYPRVGTGIFRIESADGAIAFSKLSLRIADMQGVVKQSFRALNGGMELDLSAYAPGMYLLQFQAENTSWIQRIIKQ